MQKVKECMPILQENKVIEKKYASVTFGNMSTDERKLSAYSVILKISAITGWTIPASDQILDILVDQFEQKLDESYRNVNQQEVEYAFRNRGIDVKDWGKVLNLTMIDEVMIPYLQHRFELSKTEESLHSRFDKNIDSKKELTDQEWDEWLEDIKKYNFNLIPCSAYDYLVKKELLKLSNEQKHGYMDKAIKYLLSTFEPGTKEMIDYCEMKSQGKFTAKITASLVTTSKRFATSDYLKMDNL